MSIYVFGPNNVRLAFIMFMVYVASFTFLLRRCFLTEEHRENQANVKNSSYSKKSIFSIRSIRVSRDRVSDSVKGRCRRVVSACRVCT